jgi:hypothetical protein
VIRDGIRAMLAERAIQVEAAVQDQQRRGWTSFQLADRILLEKLSAIRAKWVDYTEPAKRDAALKRFREYAYQWY